MASIARRPGIVTVVAVILIIVGIWGLFAAICGGGAIAFMSLLPEQPGKAPAGDPAAPMRFIAQEVPGYFAIVLTSLAISLLFAGADLGCGIGVLRMSSTARLMAIVLTIVKLLYSVAMNAYSVLVVAPVQDRFFQLNPQPGAAAASVMTYVGMGVAMVIQLALAITVIAILLTPSVRAAFANASRPPSPDDPPRRRDEYDDDYFPPTGSSPRTGITDRPPLPPETGISDRS